MTVQKLNESAVAIKSGNATLVAATGGNLKVGDYAVTGPGEYDSAGISLLVRRASALAMIEALQVAVVWGDEAVGEEWSADVDVLVLLDGSQESVGKLIGEVDPRAVVTALESLADVVKKHEGDGIESVASYKAVAGSLPTETRAAILLT